jgi:DNA-binding response OmpR family regulator
MMSSNPRLPEDLAPQGFTVDTAEDGVTGLQKVRSGNFDLVLITDDAGTSGLT